MYITITPHKIEGNYAQSASDFVAYLEKENEGKPLDKHEHFFNHYGEEITSAEVIKEIDGNTAKLKKTEPKFYSITINPSKRELEQLQNHSVDLKAYTRELMKDYAEAFNREINGQKITVDDIKYYAKIEYERTYKGTDQQIQENQPYATKILQLKHDIRAIQEGKLVGSIKEIQSKINRLEKEAPHQQNGKRIVRGMPKEGAQSHIHVIVSRKDSSNSVSLSPGSKHKASEVTMHNKSVKRGFDRDSFFAASEKTFDRIFQYKRNYVETYKARKTLLKNPKLYFTVLSGLPTNEKAMAYKMLAKSGVPIMSIPTNKVQLTLKAIKKIKQGLNRAIQSSSIGI
ncbi:mobilization protein [Flagellimonas sp. 389]|uniref:MobB family relaxase n=1 Tax=Flagellimonas sp. 389 TaxID=2835862 RepID=UPI001BD1EEF6|nr:MobB family relaxase [Flagellimonas sp. 389]MBS9462912.1 mobilization protein [Flagellimonas sp. 389]